MFLLPKLILATRKARLFMRFVKLDKCQTTDVAWQQMRAATLSYSHYLPLTTAQMHNVHLFQMQLL